MDNETLNFDAWQLMHIAQALTRAKRLEALRTAFHKELYACIRWSTTTFDKLEPRQGSVSTDLQAIKIIEAKERYEKKIQNEYDKYIRWQCFLQLANPHDQGIMVRYFQKKKYVRPEAIKSLLFRLKDTLEGQETQIEKERADQAKKDHHEFLRTTKITKMPKRKISIFEDGRWRLVDPDEYEREQQRKRFEEQREEMRRYFREEFYHKDAL